MIKRAGDLRGISGRKEKTDKPYISSKPCSVCDGGRLKKLVLESKVNNKNIGEYANLEISKLKAEVKKN